MAVAAATKKASSTKKKTGRREYGKGKKRDVKRNIPTDLIPLENETWLLQPIAVTMMRHDYSLIQIRILVSVVEKMQQKLREMLDMKTLEPSLFPTELDPDGRLEIKLFLKVSVLTPIIIPNFVTA